MYCMDDTKQDGSHPAIMAFVLADKSWDFTRLSCEERYDEGREYHSSITVHRYFFSRHLFMHNGYGNVNDKPSRQLGLYTPQGAEQVSE